MCLANDNVSIQLFGLKILNIHPQQTDPSRSDFQRMALLGRENNYWATIMWWPGKGGILYI